MTDDINIEINATNAQSYSWRVTGEDAGAAAGDQGTEPSLKKAIQAAAGKLHADKIDGVAWVEYIRAKYDADFPECEGRIRATGYATVAGLYETPDKAADYLVSNAK